MLITVNTQNKSHIQNNGTNMKYRSLVDTYSKAANCASSGFRGSVILMLWPKSHI